MRNVAPRVSVATGSLTILWPAFTEKVRKAVARYAKPTIFDTMVGSAALNAMAFGWLASGWMIWPAVVLGLVIPVLIFCLTKVGVALWQN